jgi:hypothetical protein
MRTMSTEKKFHTVENHPLDFYIPADENIIEEFFLISPCKSNVKVPIAKAINITQGQRPNDGKWVLHFELLQTGCVRYFDKFCKDLFESTTSISDKADGPDAVIRAFKNWKSMFSTDNIDKEDIQGVMGELLFLMNYIIPRYGEITGLKAWTKVIYGKQDFNIDDTWYEVKSIKVGTSEVTISSLDQLNNPNSGHLVIIKLQESTSVSSTAINLNNVYKMLHDKLTSQFSIDAIENAMEFYNIPSDYYDDYNFEYISMNIYSVTTNFPRLVPSDMPRGINVPSYGIILATIDHFKEV